MSRLLVVTLIFSIIIFGLSIYANLGILIPNFDSYEYIPPFKKGLNFNNNGELGAEYFNLAKSLVSNKGFSNPFAVPTGSSAWMPPLYPSILAILLKIFLDRETVMWSVIILQNLSLVFTGFTIYQVAKRTSNNKLIYIIVPLYTLWLCFNFPFFFQSNHDTWFIMLLIDFMLLLIISSKNNLIYWGLLGGATILTCPVAIISWLVSVLRKTKLWVFPFFITGFIALFWVSRNWIQFNRIILIKSNLFFELAYSNIYTEDGIYDNTVFKKHPYYLAQIAPLAFARNVKNGEMGIIDGAKHEFLRYLIKNPYDFGKKIINRFLVATLYYKTFFPQFEVKHPWYKIIYYSLPFIGLISLLTVFKSSLDYIKVSVVIIYLSYLLPYIIVAYYIRYLLPLTPILILLQYWLASEIIGRFVTLKE
jgi:hypothetical protein